MKIKAVEYTRNHKDAVIPNISRSLFRLNFLLKYQRMYVSNEIMEILYQLQEKQIT